MNIKLYENANKYRLHQDTIRWTLLAGYAAFFAATATLLMSEPVQACVRWRIALSLVLFAIGAAYLIVLAVENWFYNLFSGYVRDCEENITLKQSLRTMAAYSKDAAPHISPFHPSFYFAELILLAGNGFYLYAALDALSERPIYFICLSNEAVFAFTWLFYATFCHYCLRNWNQRVYKPFIEKLQNIYRP
jgi:hypothetical protein